MKSKLWPHDHTEPQSSLYPTVFCSAGTGYKSGLNDYSFSESSPVVITATTTTTINKIIIIMSQYVNTSQFELIKFKLSLIDLSWTNQTLVGILVWNGALEIKIILTSLVMMESFCFLIICRWGATVCGCIQILNGWSNAQWYGIFVALFYLGFYLFLAHY